MDKNMCEKITTHPISYIMQGQTDVSARNTREHKQLRANTSIRTDGNPLPTFRLVPLQQGNNI
jgi:hypothetical protein